MLLLPQWETGACTQVMALDMKGCGQRKDILEAGPMEPVEELDVVGREIKAITQGVGPQPQGGGGAIY